MVIFHSYVNVYQRVKHLKSKRMCSSIFFSIIQVFLIIHFKLALNYIMISSSCSPSSNVLSIIRKIITKLLIQIGELEMGNFQHSQRSYLPNTRFLWLALYIYIYFPKKYITYPRISGIWYFLIFQQDFCWIWVRFNMIDPHHCPYAKPLGN